MTTIFKLAAHRVARTTSLLLSGYLVATLLCGCEPARGGPSEAAALGPYRFDPDRVEQWKLPKRLKEISGLALTPIGTVLAHDDERGVIYEIDAREGAIVRTTQLGQPQLNDDFEGIAILDNWLFVTNSRGIIWRGELPGQAEVPIQTERFDPKLGRHCEFEGLTADASDRTVALLCKSAKRAPLSIYWLSADDPSNVLREVELPESQITAQLSLKTLHPSGFVWNPAKRHFLVIAAREKATFLLDTDGSLLAATSLPKPQLHSQPEGIALAANEDVLIADEGKNRRARLSRYPQR